MTEMKLTILNEQTFNQAFAMAGDKFRKGMEDTLTFCAIDLVEKPAAILAQRNFLHPTGNLPASIFTEIAPSGMDAKIGTNIIYGPLREYGGDVSTPWPGRGPYRTVRHVGRPYLTKAFSDAKEGIKERFHKMLNRVLTEIDKEAGG